MANNIPIANARNYEYNDAPNARNIIMMNDSKINELVPSQILFKHGPSFFYYEKEHIDADDHSRWVFECNQMLAGGTPRRNQIKENDKYYSLSGPNMNYIVPLSQLRKALGHTEFKSFELVQTGVIPHTASYLAIIYYS